jgi:hypothetical protein
MEEQLMNEKNRSVDGYIRKNKGWAAELKEGKVIEDGQT